MSKLLRRLIPQLEEHLSDDRLASLFCRELSFPERLIARQHLVDCWQCRLRQEDLEGRRADQVLDLYRVAFSKQNLTLPSEPRATFVRKLELHIQDVVPQKWWAFHRPQISLPESSAMNPALAVCMVLCLATALSFFFWWQQRVPGISSTALLVRAERWDTASLARTQGVVYQAVRITMTRRTEKHTITRSIYRDVQGKRQPKQARLDEKEEQLRSTLTQAGLDWNEPLSAVGYQGWHDHQRVRKDHITRTGRHLLQLTTAVPDGLVSEQSLTVRATDFHPIRRTITLRDSGMVEIAEVDFKILPWSAVDANVFAPLANPLHEVAMTPVRVLSFPRLAETLSEGQLDEAELGARLMLNQLHADTGEQIDIHRTPQAVVVDGLVETAEQKRDLQAKLRLVPHLTVSIQSVEDLNTDPARTDVATSVKTASMPDQPSPLEIYMHEQGRSISDVNILAHQLFNNALTISQESKAIVDLQEHFGSDGQRTIIASATLSELIYSHHERLEAALKRERQQLADAQSIASISQGSFEAKTSSLADAAEKNLALSKELTQTNSPAVRSAEKILAEMSTTMDYLTSEVHEAYGKSQGGSTLSGKK